MSYLAYLLLDDRARPLVWLRGAVKAPPFSMVARQEGGRLLRRIQRGETLTMPHSRPMPAIGRRCHELRIDDDRVTWRIVYRTDPDAVVIVDVFQKTTQTTPADVVAACRRRLARYDADASEET
jgi:phage-related protein